MMNQQLLKAAFLSAGLAGLALSTGCLENEPRHRRDRDEERVVIREERTERVVVPAEGGWYDDRRYDGGHFDSDSRERHRRTGAAANVPNAAREVSIGRGLIAWTAEREQYVWVTDSEHDAVMWSGTVYRGETVEVVPRHNRIFVGRREVARFEHMKDEIRYRIWADRTRP